VSKTPWDVEQRWLLPPSVHQLVPTGHVAHFVRDTAARRSGYRLRNQIVEPVFGQIKQARGSRQFLLRGISKVRGEWAMICTVHKLLKLTNATR